MRFWNVWMYTNYGVTDLNDPSIRSLYNWYFYSKYGVLSDCRGISKIDRSLNIVVL